MNDSAHQFPYNYPVRGSFVVKNIITNSNKTIRIFDYPILVGMTRNLLLIPGINEADIRASLLKGTLRNKLMAGEIEIIQSDIDLLQFSQSQKIFLTQSGLERGHQISYLNMSVRHIENELLVNNGNLMFTVNNPPFIQDNFYKIIVFWNGIRQAVIGDYTISESGGTGTGYDTITMIEDVAVDDVITVNYYVKQ